MELAQAAHESARVIVKFRPGSELARMHALAATPNRSETLARLSARADSLGARTGLPMRSGRALDAHTQVVGADGISSAALAARLAADADVEYAVIDQRRRHFAIPSDPLYTQGPAISNGSGGPAAGQWYLHAPAGEVVSSIDAASAWDITTGSSDIVVAVLDTGVRPEHPDFAGRLLAGYDMVSDIPTANDDNARDSSASDPGDWVSASESGDVSGDFFLCGEEDSTWHGTMTASVIGAASDNGIGMAGVAWGIKLLPVRVLGKCGGFDSDIIAGMNWAAGLPVPGIPTNPFPARVINLSLGGAGSCDQSYLDAIGNITDKQSPAVIVAAAGNSAGHAVGTPANCPGVIGVAGLRHAGTKVGFSDLGPEISISAPGGNCVNLDPSLPCLYPILAATNTGTTIPASSTYTDSFNASFGTSFSAPLVSGTAALMLSVQPALTPAEVKAALQSSARAFPSASSEEDAPPVCHSPNNSAQLECFCTTSTCGAGMLDAAAAVAAIMPLPNHTDSWWNANESGWGITITDHGSNAFVQWYTYDSSGHNQKYVIPGGTFSEDKCTFSGDLSHVSGPSWTDAVFNPALVTRRSAGTASFDFCPTGLADGTIVFSYTADGVAGSKQLTRLPFGDDVPRWGETANTGAPDFSDLWWNPNESGWGVSVTQHGSDMFFRVFPYDTDNRPLLFVVPVVTFNSSRSFTGNLVLTSGPWFGTEPFDPNQVTRTTAGTATLNFSDADNGTLTYTVNGTTVTKAITRLVF